MHWRGERTSGPIAQRFASPVNTLGQVAFLQVAFQAFLQEAFQAFLQDAFQAFLQEAFLHSEIIPLLHRKCKRSLCDEVCSCRCTKMEHGIF